MSTDSASFCLARCCRSAAVTLAVGFAALAVAASVRGSAAPNRISDVAGRGGGLQHPRVVVLKSKRVLHLFDGQALIRTYPVALGSDPVGDKLLAGDGRTPLGLFRICTKKRSSEHHRFLGISYPTAEAAERGLAEGLLTAGEARAIVAADAEGRCPPWLTAVGGGIGLHGQGTARTTPGTDWTEGCVALSDRDVEELFGVLRVGDEVEILP